MVQRSMSQIKVYKNVLGDEDYKNILFEVESREVAWYKGAVLYDENQSQFNEIQSSSKTSFGPPRLALENPWRAPGARIW